MREVGIDIEKGSNVNNVSVEGSWPLCYSGRAHKRNIKME